MTTYRRGDVVLVRIPEDPGTAPMLRPAVVLHPELDSDLGVSLLPLVPLSSAGPHAIPIERASFESARMGLVTTLALDPDISVDLPRSQVARSIGRCPYELLNELMRRRRSPLASAVRDSQPIVAPVIPIESHRHRSPYQTEWQQEPRAEDKTELEAEAPSAAFGKAGETVSEQLKSPLSSVSPTPTASTASPTSVFGGRDDLSNRFPVERARYTCMRTPEPITIDGDLTKPVWQAAPVSDRFADMVHGKPAWFDTRVRLLWDDDYLYFGFTAEETDVWGTLTERDSKIYEENDLEIFIAGKDAYYEFEISACNVIYEVFWIWKDVHQPGGPFWGRPEFNPAIQRTMSLDGVGGHVHPRGERWGFLDWDCPGLQHAVKVDGTLNQRDDTDKGWSAEIAIPWSSLTLLADGRSLPPSTGDIWRIDCSRFQKIGEHGESLDPCAGWSWNLHGHYDSHIPEVFPYVTFSDEVVNTNTVSD